MQPRRERQIYSDAERWKDLPAPIRAWVYRHDVETLVTQEPESGVVWHGASKE